MRLWQAELKKGEIVIFTRFAFVTAVVAMTFAFATDLITIALSRKLGGFGLLGSPWQWLILVSGWWGISLATAYWISCKVRWRIF